MFRLVEVGGEKCGGEDDGSLRKGDLCDGRGRVGVGVGVGDGVDDGVDVGADGSDDVGVCGLKARKKRCLAA